MATAHSAHNSCTKGTWLCATTAIGSVIFHQAGDTPFQNRYYIPILKHKIWLGKIWRIYSHSPNSPTFPPAKVSLHTVRIYVER